MPMLQQASEACDAALTRLEKISELFEHGSQRIEDGFVMFQLVKQVVLAAETLSETKTIAQICIAAG